MLFMTFLLVNSYWVNVILSTSFSLPVFRHLTSVMLWVLHLRRGTGRASFQAAANVASLGFGLVLCVDQCDLHQLLEGLVFLKLCLQSHFYNHRIHFTLCNDQLFSSVVLLHFHHSVLFVFIWFCLKEESVYLCNQMRLLLKPHMWYFKNLSAQNLIWPKIRGDRLWNVPYIVYYQCNLRRELLIELLSAGIRLSSLHW